MKSGQIDVFINLHVENFFCRKSVNKSFKVYFHFFLKKYNNILSYKLVTMIV